MNLKTTIESILFVAGRPVSLKELEKILDKPREEIQSTLEELMTQRQSSGVLILKSSDEYLLSTNPDSSKAVKDFLNAELREKLTEAGLETLAIVAYKQPVTRAEIEAIRGVNSQYTLRHLLMRGLIEKTTSTKDARVMLYKTTHEFMQHMGLKDMKDLPEFEELTKAVNPPAGFASSAPTSPDVGKLPEGQEKPPVL